MYLIEQEIFLISQDNEINWRITKKLIKKGYIIYTSHTVAEALGKVLDTPPALFILHEAQIKGNALGLLKSFKKNNLFSHIPIILLVSPKWGKKVIDWYNYPVEDYFTTAFTTNELINRVSLCVSRSNRSLDPNPLTRLPGNTSILREIQRVLDLGQEVAISHLDIDNFKAFNDKYGFARGDEAIRMTARILSNILQDYKNEEVFVGHIGGDDFVFIVPSHYADEANKKIIKSFDSIVQSLYEDEDRKKGYIISKDRLGKNQSFPIMTVSIAVVKNDKGKYLHYGEVSEVASQIKNHLKRLPKSNYMINQRK